MNIEQYIPQILFPNYTSETSYQQKFQTMIKTWFEYDHMGDLTDIIIEHLQCHHDDQTDLALPTFLIPLLHDNTHNIL